ncbi:hypothetical protein DFH11DRAFT_1265099 [Phellopilus nigrolimitatus]|nr:hypothetical protein DFH11DRAFT_1265099 [Phellopilus nigrolimitatus]
MLAFSRLPKALFISSGLIETSDAKTYRVFRSSSRGIILTNFLICVKGGFILRRVWQMHHLNAGLRCLYILAS